MARGARYPTPRVKRHKVFWRLYRASGRREPIWVSSNASFFDYHAKYESAETQEICPAPLAPELTAHIQEMARLAHEALECGGLTRSDFIIAQDETMYFLEINTIPGLTEASLCPKEARAAGISFPDFLDMQLDLALRKRKLRTPRIDA